MGRQVVVIGAGVGGLAAAIRLQAAGQQVTLLERAAAPGGKLRQVPVGELCFDGGPSVLTMPFVFDELFACAGARRADEVRFVPVSPACRHFFPDGTVLDLYNDEPAADHEQAQHLAADDPALDQRWARSAAEIERVLGARSAAEYRAFRRELWALYQVVSGPFMMDATPLPRHPLGLVLSHGLATLRRMATIDTRRTVWQALERRFHDERLRVLFARYATYCGCDPFTAPATLNVIPHVELAFGLYTVEGGMYRLAEALQALALRLGVRLRCSAEVERVELSKGERRAQAVHVGGERLPADAVVANCDAAQLFGRLLQGTRLGAGQARAVTQQPASLSAYLRLVAAREAAGLPLCHHNVFFSADYPREFDELWGRGGQARAPGDPTVYLCAPDVASGAALQRWFFLTNAPALPRDADAGWDAEQKQTCRARIAAQLARHGIALDRHAQAERSVTPRDFEALFPQSRGALYGAAGNSRTAAFARPSNTVRGVENLYCVGGSTHPGAGVPMVALSARLTATQLLARG